MATLNVTILDFLLKDLLKKITLRDIFTNLMKRFFQYYHGINSSLWLGATSDECETAFLNGDLEENVYMDQPMGFSVEGKEYIVCKLKKSIYSLKQASRQWYLRFNDIIVSFRFKENIVDQCIYMKVGEIKVIFLIL